jgi:hypothetical protein
MADTSTYAKMRDIIATVRKMRRCTIDALTSDLSAKAAVEANGFVYYRRNARGQVEPNPCTGTTIRKHVRFCQELGILTQDSDLRLSNAARNIKTKADYNTILEVQIIEYLEKCKITLSAIERAINGTKTPDPEAIYDALPDNDVSEERFRSCLNLLSIAGNTIVPYRKKIYLIHA